MQKNKNKTTLGRQSLSNNRTLKTTKSKYKYLYFVDKLLINLQKSYSNTITKIDTDLEIDLFNLADTGLDLFNVGYSNKQEIYELSNFRLVRNFKKHTNFNLCYTVYYKQIEFANLYLDLRNNLRNNTYYIGFEVVNQILYTDFIEIYLDFLNTFNCGLHNITRLDICIDSTENFIDKFSHYYFNPVKYQSSISTILVEQDRFRNISWILAGADKNTQVSIYNKSKELVKSKKEYISASHKNNGLDTTKPVYRLELRLHAKSLKDYKKINDSGETDSNNRTLKTTNLINNSIQTERTEQVIDILQLNNTDYLKAIIKANINRVFEFRINTNTRFSRCKETIQFLDLTDTDIQVQYEMSKLTPAKTSIEKQTVLKLSKLYKQTGDKLHLNITTPTPNHDCK